MYSVEREANARMLGEQLEILCESDGKFEIKQLLLADDTASLADSEEMFCRPVSEFSRVYAKEEIVKFLILRKGKSHVMERSSYGKSQVIERVTLWKDKVMERSSYGKSQVMERVQLLKEPSYGKIKLGKESSYGKSQVMERVKLLKESSY